MRRPASSPHGVALLRTDAPLRSDNRKNPCLFRDTLKKLVASGNIEYVTNWAVRHAHDGASSIPPCPMRAATSYGPNRVPRTRAMGSLRQRQRRTCAQHWWIHNLRSRSLRQAAPPRHDGRHVHGRRWCRIARTRSGPWWRWCVNAGSSGTHWRHFLGVLSPERARSRHEVAGASEVKNRRWCRIARSRRGPWSPSRWSSRRLWPTISR